MLAFAGHKRFPRFLGHPLTFVAGFVALSFAFHLFNRKGGYYGTATDPIWIWLPTLEGIGSAFLATTYLAWRVPIPKPVDRVLAWLGTISYSLYLNHSFVVMACFAAAARFNLQLRGFNDYTLFSLLVILPALVACSALTYYIVELPFLKLRSTYTIPRATPVVQARAA